MVAGLFALGLGAILLWVALRTAGRLRRSRRWPTVQGRILERGVGRQHDQRRYHTQVKYAYRVAGRDYVNDRIYAEGWILREAKAVQRFVDRLPDPLPVRYDPDDPSRSHLLPSPAWTVWVMGIMSAATVFCAAVYLLAQA